MTAVHAFGPIGLGRRRTVRLSSMFVALPPTLERWLRDPKHAEVPATWVPGLAKSERQALHAVGGVAGGLLDVAQVAVLPSEVRAWIQAAPTPPADGLDAFREQIGDAPDQAFASLYSAIVSRANRRQLGTFFTPSAEVKLMLDLWTESEELDPETVIDVGAGVGVFTAEAAKRWSEARIVAVDINPVTLGLLAVRLFSSASTDDAHELLRRVELVRRDYTEWFASNEAPSPGRRLILGNPPYTRAQLMSRAERERLQELTDSLCGLRASLSTIITAQTFQRLGPTDGLSLLLPAQWLESQYARDLRAAIWKSTRRRVELRLVESEDLFGGAQVDAVALLIGTEQPAVQSFRVARWRGAAVNALDRTSDAPPTWRQSFDIASHAPRADQKTRPLSEFADVHRGVATGANGTFVVSQAEASELPKRAVTRIITRLSEFEDDINDAAIRAASTRAAGWLLTIDEKLSTEVPAIAARIEAAEGKKIHERVLCSRRAVWYDLTAEVRRADVLIGSMTQDRFKFVRNAVGATHTNNLYGMTWREDVSPEQQAQVLSWLRSEDGQTALRLVARRQGAGLLKLEPGGLRQLRIPLEAIEPVTVPQTELLEAAH